MAGISWENALPGFFVRIHFKECFYLSRLMSHPSEVISWRAITLTLWEVFSEGRTLKRHNRVVHGKNNIASFDKDKVAALRSTDNDSRDVGEGCVVGTESNGEAKRTNIIGSAGLSLRQRVKNFHQSWGYIGTSP